MNTVLSATAVLDSLHASNMHSLNKVNIENRMHNDHLMAVVDSIRKSNTLDVDLYICWEMDMTKMAAYRHQHWSDL